VFNESQHFRLESLVHLFQLRLQWYVID
jgi:hypothetical protein